MSKEVLKMKIPFYRPDSDSRFHPIGALRTVNNCCKGEPVIIYAYSSPTNKHTVYGYCLACVCGERFGSGGSIDEAAEAWSNQMKNIAETWLRDQMRMGRNAFQRNICEENFEDGYISTEKDEDPVGEWSYIDEEIKEIFGVEDEEETP